MPRPKLPSTAQAKLLAKVWAGTAVPTHADDLTEPTTMACYSRGWLAETGEIGTYPNGRAYSELGLTDAGMLALAQFFNR